MINLMCGCNYDEKLIKGYAALNQKYIGTGIKITEVYGSVANDPIGCARERNRLPHPKNIWDTIYKISSLALKNDITLNYTINRSCIGSIEDFYSHDYKSFISFLNFLSESGIRRVTVAHPLLMEIIQKESNKLGMNFMRIEVSTIYHLYAVRQLRFLKKNFPLIDKLCGNLMTNRDISFLQRLNVICKDLNVSLELMANEACIFGCHNRMFHYNMQSHTIDHEKLFDNWPIGYCTRLHHTIPVEWLKARLIRPEDMRRYEIECGIHNFKITGRTHTTEDQLRIVEIYMKQRHDGNLLDIFPHFKKIYDQSASGPAIYFDNRKLDNFLDMWFDDPDWRCTEHCDFDCAYCENIALEAMKRD